ncbi:alkaline-phosphatase-like protein [Pavlovales sp. CCMP2436]|nr:alkaline-phosphatase-like protein [Pavlovales sp. CCMP2436]
MPQTGGLPGATGPRGVALRPNVLIFLADDMGYSDPKAFGEHVVGHSNNTTPNLDKLAAEGLMLTQFLTEVICTPARAALLTGRYPARYGMSQDVLPQRVLFTPGAPSGLPKRELTVASALRAAGYRTALTGKWHLGISAASVDGSNGTNAFLPAHHGFDDSLVFPFSNFQKCDPYAGRSPPDPELSSIDAAMSLRRREAARSARRSERDAATAQELSQERAEGREQREGAREERQLLRADGADEREGEGGVRAEEGGGQRRLRTREEGAARGEDDEEPLITKAGWGKPIQRVAGWRRGSAKVSAGGWEMLSGKDEADDEERGRLERLIERELERDLGRDERLEGRHERQALRHSDELGATKDPLVRTAADAFAHAAGLASEDSAYGYAQNGLFCFLMANNSIVQQPADMLSLEDALVRHATTFIRRAVAAEEPFLLYFSDLHPHTALFNHPRFGPGPPGPFESGNGQYGQVLREMDWAVGELLTTLDELEVARDTLVIFTSDNGPYQEEGWDISGRKGGLKGGKGQTWEGGIRVPAIIRWPGVVPAGAVSSAPVRALDLMPTVCAFAGVALPSSLRLDGVDQSLFFQRPMDAYNGWLSQRRTSFHYCGEKAIAARYMDYKVHWATQRWDPGHEATCTECCPRAGYTAGLFGSTTLCQCDGKSLEVREPPLLFNIRKDPNETRPIKPGSYEHSHIVNVVANARAEHLRTMEEDVPCVNCPLPVPLKTWPCCAGSLPQCHSEGQCGIGAGVSAACTYALVDHLRHGHGRCECNHCRKGDCGTGWE